MDRSNGQQRRSGPPGNRPLSARPMAGAFKGVRVGPTCLHCQRTIDARQGLSLSNPRGARGAQRQGYLHSDCLTEAGKKYHEETVQLLTNPFRRTVTVTKSLPLAVPVLDEEEIEEILNSRGVAQ